MLTKSQITSLCCFVSVCLFTITGCGSGGGGGSPNNASIPQPVKADFNVTFSPASLSADILETAKTTWTVLVTVQGQVDGDVAPVIVDNSGIITDKVYLEQLSTTQYKVTFNVSNILAAGKYDGAIKLRLCSSATCAKEYSGSPWSLPYSVTVKSHHNLINLTPIAQYSGWGSYFGDANNTGYVPVTLDKNQFSYRWIKRLPLYTGANAVITENDKIFLYTFDTNDVNSGPYAISALNEWDGTTLWQKDYKVASNHSNRGFGLHVANNLLSFVRYSPPNGDTYFTALNAADGNTSIEHKVWDQSFAGSGATLDGDAFYLYGNFNNSYGFGKLTRSNGTRDWVQIPTTAYGESLISKENWLPVLDANSIYIFNQPTCNPLEFCDPSGLSVLDKKTGEKVVFIADPAASPVNRGEIMPPILTDYGVLALNGRMTDVYNPFEKSLSLYNIKDKKVSWTASASFIFQPVVANKIVYTTAISRPVAGSQTLTIEARELATGNILWTLSYPAANGGLSSIKGGMIITDNMLFIGSSENVTAIDINTHKIVWEYPFGGNIALTQSGVLLVARDAYNTSFDTFILSAISLKN